MSALQKSAVLRTAMAGHSLPPRGMMSRGPGRGRHQTDFTPIHWSQFFAKKESVIVGENKFCVYSVLRETAEGAPVVVLLHGGGFSALSWGAMGKVLSSYINVQIIAFDLRGHGETTTTNDDDLSIGTLSTDVVDVLRKMDLQNHSLIVMGHSLGGAVAVHSIHRMTEHQEFHVVASIVIDVVEGSAMDSLSTMHSVLRQRPNSFPTITRAVEWAMKSGILKNNSSARLSMPGQLKNMNTGECATLAVHEGGEKTDDVTNQSETGAQKTLSGSRTDVILEEEVLDSNLMKPPEMPPTPTKTDGYTWRIDLHKTEPFWQGWFKGMSSLFLSIHCPKMLMLAGVDRLDKDLTVGQMQGKFQMHVLPNVGHAVHEDSPEEVAESVCSFLVRHKLVSALREFNPVFPGC